MKKHIYIIFLTSLIVLLATTSCSKKKYPTDPSQPGKVTLINNGDDSIIIKSYTHIRGAESKSRTLDRTLANGGYSYSFVNLLDNNGSYFFEGGDKVVFVFESTSRNPSNPSDPVFSGSAVVEVNGNRAVKVKNGGDIEQ